MAKEEAMADAPPPGEDAAKGKAAGEKGKGKGKDKDAPVDPDADLSEEDLALRADLEMLVGRVGEGDAGVATAAVSAIGDQIRSATTSMTSVPKPLKFLRRHYDGLKATHEKLAAASSPVAGPLADVLSVLGMTAGPEGGRDTLRFRLRGSGAPVGDWGHEYVRHITGEISAEYKERSEKEETGKAPEVGDLLELVAQIIPYHMSHNAEPEAVDLLVEVERLDLLAAEVRQVFEEQLAAVALEGEEGLAARLEALDPADRVDLSRVLALKPKPQRPAGAPPLPEGAEGGGAGALRVERFPALMVNAINEVLYTRHGFRRSQRHGEPRESHITALLEDGEGSPVAMGILYTEVCRRVGLPVAGMPIEDPMGQYYVLWPTKFPLKVGGLEYVVDPYGNGDLLQKSEVCEVFDITPGAIKPASNRRILSAVLSYMRDAYWARAVGCSPEPALMEPLDLASVSELEWDMEWDEGSFNLSRALACAERRLHLLPGDQQAQLQYALLHYAAGDFETAWQELGIYEERGAGADVCDEHIPFLMERLRMYLEFGVKQRPDGESTFPGLQITDHDDNSS
mmetsp:Transcript_5346/g.13660  ORF Transcript_5346/g.13660 Transcript_5346/m.13660 type:complete len:570 (+) Transcript_5346:130-1839(+)